MSLKSFVIPTLPLSFPPFIVIPAKAGIQLPPSSKNQNSIFYTKTERFNLPPPTPPYQGGELKEFSFLSRRVAKRIFLLIKEGKKIA